MEPDEVQQRSFPISNEGFNQSAVRAFLREVAEEMKVLRSASGQGSLNLSRGVAEQTSKILATAETAVEEIKAQARKDGEAAVAAIRADASEILARARSEAGEIIAEARAEAGRIKREHEVENKKIDDDIRRLKESRTVLATQLEDVGRRLEEMIIRLRGQFDDWPGHRGPDRSGEARRAPEFDRPSQNRPVPDPPRARDHGHPAGPVSAPPSPGASATDTALASRPPSGPGSVPNGVPAAGAPRDSATLAPNPSGSEGTPPEPPAVVQGAGPPAGPEAAPEPPAEAAHAVEPAAGQPADPQVPVQGEPGSNGAPQAPAESRLPQGGPEARAGAGAPQPAAEDPDATVTFEVAADPSAPGDQDPLSRRGSQLGDTPAKASARLKRLLQEDQNVLLDRIRRMRPGGDFGREIAPVDEQSARFEGGMREALESAYAAGRRAAGATAEDPKRAGDIVSMLVQKQLVAPLRRDLSRVVTAGQENEEPTAQLAERCNEVYRVWKGVRAELLGEGLVFAAYHHGLIGGWRESGTAKKRWVVADEEQGCPKDVCKTNGAGGSFAVEGYFPSGHLVPPAHGACACTLAPG